MNSIYQEYYNIHFKYKNEYTQYVLLFQIGKFYEIYSNKETIESLENISEILGIQLTRVNKQLEVSRTNPQMCGFPLTSLNKFKKKLVTNGQTVIVYNQEDNNAKSRILYRIFSESCMSGEEDLQNDENLLISIYNVEETYTLISVDTFLGNVNIHLIKDKHELLSVINYLAPKEIISYGDVVENINYNGVLHRYDTFPKEYEKSKYQNEFLSKIYTSDSLSPIEYLNLEKYPEIVTNLLCVLNWVYKHNPLLIQKLNKPVIIENNLNLSFNTISQLNLITDKISVFTIINNTKTAMGKRLLKSRLLNPLIKAEAINKRYEKVKSIQGSYQELIPFLIEVKDIEKLQRKVMMNVISLNEMCVLYNSYVMIKKIYKMLGDIKKIFNVGNSTITKFNKLTNLIENTLNLEEIKNSDIKIFKENVYTDIDSLIKEYFQKYEEITKIQKSFNDIISVGMRKEEQHLKFIENDNECYFQTTKRKSGFLSKNDVDIKVNASIVKITCEKVNVLYTQSVKLKNNILLENKKKYQEFLNEMSNNFNITFINLVKTISDLDVAISTAICSDKNKYYCPIITSSQSSYIECKEIRHPIIEKIYTDTPYVPHDYTLNRNGMILHSYNFSGKSTFLRAVGISIILAQCGFFVPATSFTYYPFEKIITKIAISDNLYKNQSLFISEMQIIKQMVCESNDRTLILGDEMLCSSDHASGLSICASLIIELNKLKCNFIFSSHQHELTEIKEIKEILERNELKIYHFEVLCLKDNIEFTRKLKTGPCDERYYGIEISRKLKLNSSFVEQCLRIRNEYLNEPNDLLKNKTSRYNSNIYMNSCKICKSKTNLHTHHLIYQEKFEKENDINFHKNVKHNLVILCEVCHIKVHKNEIIIHGYIQTLNGVELKYDIIKN